MKVESFEKTEMTPEKSEAAEIIKTGSWIKPRSLILLIRNEKYPTIREKVTKLGRNQTMICTITL
jgi:hypothetical protein